ncbi:hypothetical protein [Sphingobium sp. YR657]|uniref:hypothetical protein n=1 Tax=Sphingobium sp. YR657 TaxID=1884366 RepID=UPI003137F49D
MTRRPTLIPAEMNFDPARWRPSQFQIAAWGDSVDIAHGIERNGIGFYVHSKIVARYRRKDGTRRIDWRFSATHLNSGHAVRFFETRDPRSIIPAVDDLADLCDWSFDGLDGWKNFVPDLPDRMQAWHRRHEMAARSGGGMRSEAAARVIAMSRAG